MGSHIDCIIPKDKEYSVEEIKSKLKKVFERLKAEYLHLEKHGIFTKNVNGDWWIELVPAEHGNVAYITGEGDSFNIDFYEKVIHIGSIERFSSLIPNESNFANELFKIISEISNEFRRSNKILIAEGGFGETDHIMDMACKGSDFDEIYDKMIERNGNPAEDLNELTGKIWYIKT